MGKLYIDLFTTFDGVAQAPGGPDEDHDGGFPFGGWQAPHMDELIGESVTARIEAMDALLLGRRTYEIFAAYWPHHRDDHRTADRDDPVVAAPQATQQHPADEHERTHPRRDPVRQARRPAHHGDA